jgi:hypothetical protein
MNTLFNVLWFYFLLWYLHYKRKLSVITKVMESGILIFLYVFKKNPFANQTIPFTN